MIIIIALRPVLRIKKLSQLRSSHEPMKRFALECMYCEKRDTDSAKHPNKPNQLHAAAPAVQMQNM